MTETGLKLPTKAHKPETNKMPKNLGLIVFGPAKVGKTTFASEFPNSLIIEAEKGGADYCECKKVDVTSLKEIREIYPLIKEDKELSTIVIDSLDKIASWIEEEVCKELKIETIMDTKKGERHGTQWFLYKDKVLSFIESFLALDKNIIFLAHTKKTETDSGGNILNPKTINIYGSTAIDILALIDNVGYMFVEKKDRKIKHYLSFQGGLNVEAGGRHPAIAGKIIELEQGKGYKAFESCFINKNKENK